MPPMRAGTDQLLAAGKGQLLSPSSHLRYFVAGLLVMAGLGLFLFTSALGRVWCGYACPSGVSRTRTERRSISQRS